VLRELFRDFDKTNVWVAGGLWLFILGVYAHTAAPTLSFWDCGEFIATSAILGVPHPPGAPLYTLWGRLVSMIPFYADISARINFFSAFCSSIAAVFGYLATVRVLRLWFGKDTSAFTRTLIYAGSACGALFLAFGKTQWSNSVEAEVYSLSMLVFFVVFWLALIYREHQGTSLADRILLLAAFLTFLGIGVHMTTFLIMPAVAVMFVIRKDTPARIWYLVSSFFALELYWIFALSHHSFDTPYYVPLIIVLAVYVLYALSFERLPRPVLVVGIGFILTCLPVLELIESGLRMPLMIISAAAGLGLIAYSIRMIFLWQRSVRAGQRPPHEEIAPAVFVLTALIMSGVLLLDLYGFAPFVVITILTFLVIAVMAWRHIDFPVLVAIGSASLVMVGVMPFIWGMVIGAAVIVLAGLGLKLKSWPTAFLVIVMAFLGFSVYVSIPVRSAQKPYINENTPDNFKQLVNYLERKQYGSELMIERMFARRAEWTNQFGTFRRMGFWGFFQDQYGLNGPKFLVLFVLGVFGIWEVTRRRPEAGAFITVLLLLCTVGLVLYMNFADGTRYQAGRNMDYTEVRDRDYFWTPGFMLFGLAIGMGTALIVQLFRESLHRVRGRIRQLALSAGLVLFLSPCLTLAANFYENDRSRNYLAYDYAWNVLAAADKNAVLFTAGDNDTFPLWALQEAYGVRKDVRNVILSLANTNWYIKQMRDYMGLELGWTDSQIDALEPFRTPDGRTLQVQDQVVDAVIMNNANKVPINFSATCASEERQFQGSNIDSLLTFTRFVFRLKRSASDPAFDLDGTRKYLNDPESFRTRGWGDPTFFKDEATIRTVSNFSGSFTLVSDSLRRAGLNDQAEEVLNTAHGLFPSDAGVAEQLAFFYLDKNDIAGLERLIHTTRASNTRKLAVLLSRAHRKIKDKDGAVRILDSLMIVDPTYRGTFDELMRIHMEARDVEGLKSAMKRWLAANPNDERINGAYQQLLKGWSPFADSIPKKP
jgi:hypothetical protein